MNRNFPIVFVALSMLAIAGCTIGGTPDATAPTPTATPAAQSPTPEESFNNPVVSTDSTSASATPNLIKLTNATERERIVSKGRDDPFAQIVGQTQTVATMPTPRTITTPVGIRPLPPIPPLPTPTGPRQPTPRAPISTGNTTTAASPTSEAKIPKPKTRPDSVIPEVMPGVLSDVTLEPLLPPPPQPELAEGVIVSGVVLIGQKPQAIIKVPTEDTSRYVQAGQRLASGLLIKRIEMNEGSNPIVIIEQYGIEVARMVGEQPIDSASSTTKAEAS
ncbi:hypothetical protein [Nodularia spumigena]|jgi:hypothetical protein|uniref:Uncharacterized protein n=1 Tax=Nodularia spumigena UHCC 0039 TaxID=1914872 RepID=A0A2S0Q7D8_NODSP|nr:hypothetical protein [Nodularia spumigena]AVZ30333.1 hypothetical protein BMF81_01782 [Nodularia spumigena UHCC 0039]MDB9306323.1 hypothetical protein [Nodularia spumigena CS-591/12]